MDSDQIRQLRGAVELVDAALGAAVRAAAATQQTITRQVYAPFELSGPLAAPVRVVEVIQTAITAQVYQTILGAGRAVTQSAVALLERQEGPGSDREPGTPPGPTARP